MTRIGLGFLARATSRQIGFWSVLLVATDLQTWERSLLDYSESQMLTNGIPGEGKLDS